jgi:hypothetical protein
MTAESVAPAALGAQSDALTESVSLATPLTMGRLVGRYRVAGILRQLGAAFNVSAPRVRRRGRRVGGRHVSRPRGRPRRRPARHPDAGPLRALVSSLRHRSKTAGAAGTPGHF